MTGEEKAALLLKRLTPELSHRVLQHVGPPHLERLRARMEQTESASQDAKTVAEVLTEFDAVLEKIDGTLALARQAGVSDEGPDRKTEPKLETPTPPVKPFEFDEKADPLLVLPSVDGERLALALADEPVRTVCLVLNALSTQQAGDVLKRMSPALRRQATLQLSGGVNASEVVLRRLVQALLKKCRHVTHKPPEVDETGRFRKMSDMLRLLPKPERMDILTALDEQDAVTAAAIKEYLYQFEDLLRIDDRSMQKVLGEIDSRTLGVALKGASDQIQTKIYSNLSKRAKDTLVEEMEFLGTVPAAQIEHSQKTLVEVIQRLDQSGELVMSGD